MAPLDLTPRQWKEIRRILDADWLPDLLAAVDTRDPEERVHVVRRESFARALIEVYPETEWAAEEGADLSCLMSRTPGAIPVVWLDAMGRMHVEVLFGERAKARAHLVLN